MDIIIAGAGRVGFELARNLCIGHNVTIIDKNKKALERIEEELDILPFDGDVENPSTYERLLKKEVDLFIAVTNLDNVNLISTLVAGSVLKIQKTFVRLQNQAHINNNIREKLGIDKIISPLEIASANIASLLHYPKANNVKFFKYTKHKLISFRISKNNTDEIKLPQSDFVIVGLERDEKFFIPDSNTKLQNDDLIYCFGTKESIQSVCKDLNEEIKEKTNKCVVLVAESLVYLYQRNY